MDSKGKTWRGVVAAVGMLAATLAHADVIWQEQSPGAGDSIASAQMTFSSAADPLTGIRGRLNAVVPQSGTPLYEVDVFGIYIDDYAAFSAHTVSPELTDDTALFLFDSTGHGVYMNDDTSLDFLSFLPAANLDGPPANALYYLAIGLGGFVPLDAAADIFLPGAFTDVRAADPAAGALTSWVDPYARLFEIPFDYRIDLTGARVAVIPEPATLALLLIALLTFVTLRQGAVPIFSRRA